MKALTLTQPWATLMAIGAKRVETRSWFTAYRGIVAIHAAKKFPADCKNLCYAEPFKSALGFPRDADLLWRPPEPVWVKEAKQVLDGLPLGKVVAIATLTDCVSTDRFTPTPRERQFGNYDPGRFAWIFSDIIPFETPPPARGALGLWDLNRERLL